MSNDENRWVEYYRSRIQTTRREMLDHGLLDHFRQTFPHAYRGLLRISYEEGCECIQHMPDEQQDTLQMQLDEAYRRARDFYDPLKNQADSEVK